MGRQKAAVVQGHTLAHGLPRVRTTHESHGLLHILAPSLGLQDAPPTQQQLQAHHHSYGLVLHKE